MVQSSPSLGPVKRRVATFAFMAGLDMGANVWVWIADRRGDGALTAGGSWWQGPGMAMAGGAQWTRADFHAVYIGFRCACDQTTGWS